VTDFDEHVVKVTQYKATETCVIDLLAHYDAVAELMAAMGWWLENGAGSFNGLVVSYGRKFTTEIEGESVAVCMSVYVGDGGKRRGMVSWLPSLSCVQGEM